MPCPLPIPAGHLTYELRPEPPGSRGTYRPPGPDLRLRWDTNQQQAYFARLPLPSSPPSVPSASPAGRLTFYGADSGDSAGAIAAGDFNGDTVPDLLLGADGPQNGADLAGEAYLVKGGEHLPDVIDTAAAGAAALIYGAAAKDRLGRSATMGDINGDGRDDLILAATFASGPNNDRDRAGETYVCSYEKGLETQLLG